MAFRSKFVVVMLARALCLGSLACGGSNRGFTPGSGGSSSAGADGTGAAGAGLAGSPAGTGGGAGTGTGGVDSGGASGGTGGSGAGGSTTGVGGTGTGGSSTGPNACASVDTTLPVEPTIPPACATLDAAFAAVDGTPPGEATLDTPRIQAALTGCEAGKAVKLTTGGANNAFVTGPLTLPGGVTLWVDAGTTLYGTRDPNVYGAATALITAHGPGSGIVGDGVIDGQGGEPELGATQTWWDVNGNNGDSPALIQVTGASNFTLYRITLHNAPKFHVKLGSKGFVVWGVTIKTPSRTTNSVGTKLTPSSAHNTDGIDPGEAASDGYIVNSRISVGDDQIAIKGGTNVDHVTIAHNHFLAGHGMSIGSETNGGVSNILVCDLSIDGTGTGLSGGSANGIRIKSDESRGGLVTNVTYGDVCVRGLTNPIIITPRYSAATGALIPTFKAITIQNFRSISTSTTPKVTLLGYDAAHPLGLTLDNVVIDDLSTGNISATDASVTLGPGNVTFTPSGTNVTVSNEIAGGATPNPCTGKWVTF